MVIKNIKYIATSALYRLGKNPTGRELNWMVQVAIDYFTERLPIDGFVSLKTIRTKIDNAARVFTMPSDCMRISRIGLRAGRRIWTLTPDQSLTFPDVFECEADKDDPLISTGLYPMGYFGYMNGTPFYTKGGGENSAYYRMDGNNVVFSHEIPDGELIIEYFSNGSDVDENTLINVGYAEATRLYLMSEYCLNKGTREDRSKYQVLRMEYEATTWNTNTLVKAERLSEFIDARAQSTVFNL